MDVLENIRVRYPHLTKTERKFADFILQDPTKIYAPSISALANEAGTSIASIQRFCSAIGYDGFSEFKFNVLDFLNAQEVDYSNKEWDSFLDDIKKLPSVLPQSSVQELIKSVINSNTVFTLGTHYSYTAAYELATGLVDQGFKAFPVSPDGPIREQSLPTFINGQSPIVVFSISGVKLVYPHVLNNEQFKKSTNTFLITMNKNAEMKKYFSHTILLPGNITNRNSVIDIQSIPISFIELLLNEIYNQTHIKKAHY